MKHYTLIVFKPNKLLKNYIITSYIAKDPYGIDQWIVFDCQLDQDTAIAIFNSIVRFAEGNINAILFSGKNKSTIVKQVGKAS